MTTSLHFKASLAKVYRQIFIFRNIDGCKLPKMSKDNPFLGPLLLFVNESFRGVIRECPYIGLFKIENATFNINNGSAIKKLVSFQMFPNGNYKLRISTFNEKDPNINNITIWFDAYNRDNALKQNEDF